MNRTDPLDASGGHRLGSAALLLTPPALVYTHPGQRFRAVELPTTLRSPEIGCPDHASHLQEWRGAAREPDGSATA